MSQPRAYPEPASYPNEMGRVVCSWCGALIPFEPTLDPGVVSHGCCEPCADYYFGEDWRSDPATETEAK